MLWAVPVQCWDEVHDQVRRGKEESTLDRLSSIVLQILFPRFGGVVAQHAFDTKVKGKIRGESREGAVVVVSWFHTLRLHSHQQDLFGREAMR